MLRFLFALVVAMLLMGSIALCQYLITHKVDIQLVRDAHQHGQVQHEQAESLYTLVFIPTFDVREDPFALKASGEQESVRLLVRSGKKDLVRWTDDIQRGVPIRVEDVELLSDHVEVFIETAPSGTDAGLHHALRLQILRSDVVYADETLWTTGGRDVLSRRLTIALRPQYDRLDRGLSMGAS